MTEQKFSSVGLFSGKVMWNYLSQTPQRRSRLAFVFSGQGSMFPGMAKKFQNEPIFLSFCRRAEQFLYRKKLPILSDYLFYKRRLPLEQQEVLEVYALFTFEVAASFLLIEAGFAPSVLTGHSFGEYAALVLAGSLSFENGLECVFQRESVLPARNKAGYMLAVALPEKKLRAIFEGTELYFAVKNSADQMVLSLDWWSLIQVETLLKERKVRFKRLNSSQPFHSPLLSASVHELSRKNLSNISITRPIWPVFSGVTKSWLNDDEKAEEKVKAALTNQLIEPVDFVKQVEAVSERVDHFIEISPIALLSPLIKRNAPDKKVTFGLELIPDIEESIHAPSIAIQPSILERLNSVIARVTGYSVEDIRLEKKFQEDLGIDSIKTMELSIEVMSEFCIPRDQVVFSRNIKTVGDLALMVQRRFE